MRLLGHNLSRLLLITLLLGFAAAGSAKTISAIINNTEGQPVGDATVMDGYKRVFSDHRGYFRITTRSDSLLISKLGFQPQTVLTANVPPVIRLKAKPLVLHIVRVIERYENAFNAALDRTIINADTDKPGASATTELLKESAISTSGTVLYGESSALSLLGNLSRHTLVMLDNVPLNPQGEAVDLASLPVESIRRMEIVKGSASVYGGASAIGGIIYLFTDNVTTAHAIKLDQETSYGSWEQFSHSYAFEQQTPVLSYRISLSRLSAENDFPYQPRPWWNLTGDLTRTHNRKQQQNINLSLFSLHKDISWQYKLDAETVNRQLPGPVNFLAIYENARLTGQNLRHNLHLSYKKPLGFKDDLLCWRSEDNTEYNNTRAANPVYLTHYRQSQVSEGLKNEFNRTFAGENSNLSLTGELTRQSYALRDLITPAMSIRETGRNQQAIALNLKLGDDWQLFNDVLQAGVRLDHTDQFETFTSWRLEGVLKSDGLIQTELGAAYGTGFSLPSFYDLYWKGDAQSLGNPDLEPETSRGGNLKLQAKYKSWSLQTAYYANTVRQLIQWRQSYLYGTVWKPVNIGRANLHNLEISGGGKPLDWLELKSTVTFTRALDTVLDAKLTYTPEYRWVNDLTLNRFGLELNLNLDSSGRQWTTPDNLIAPLPAFTLFNASLLYQITLHKFQAGCWLNFNNLFDKQYEIYAYVPQPGFNWLSGFKISYAM